MEETLGKRIVYHRKRMKLTQEQLAEKLDVTPQAVSKWENDQSCPDITMLPRLADVFGISADALLGRETVYEGEVVEEDAESGFAIHHNENERGTFHASVADKDGWEFHWDSGRRGALTSAVFVLLVGGLLFADRYFGWDVGFWSITWPSALLVYGLAALLRSFRATNLICTLVGAYFLVENLGIYDIALDRSLLLPGIILAVGLSLLVDALRKPKKGRFRIHKKGDISHKKKGHFTQKDEKFECSLAFGEAYHNVSLPRLAEGEASVSFGEMTLDITSCGEIADGCHIEANVSFGELRLRVPRQYRVDCNTGISFGDITTHGHPDNEPQGVIELDGGASFGELIIQYV